jgi:hypothetical protein
MTAMLLCLGLAFSGAAFAQEMQERMKDCNARAGDKKGDERKRFMRTCLKAPSAKAAKADNAAGETTESQGLLFKCNQDAERRAAQEIPERVPQGKVGKWGTSPFPPRD